MGNPDLIIVFNQIKSFFINGTDYDTRKEAINIALFKYGVYVNEVLEMAEKPEELNLEITSINIYEFSKEQQ